MHCTTCTIDKRCHVSANGSVVPPMVLRYWHDRRVGKGTNQHCNGLALATFIAAVFVLLQLQSTYVRVTTARPPLNAECCVAPAKPCNSVSLTRRCVAHTGPLPVCYLYRIDTVFVTDKARFALFRRRTRATRTPSPLYHHTSYLPFPSRFRIRTTDTRTRSRSLDKPPCVEGLYHTGLLT